MPQAFLSAIFIYPVKSLSGIEVQEWEVGKKGLKLDRQWMLIDQNGRFLSQRQKPEMALIKPKLIGDAIILTAPDVASISIPLEADDCQQIDVTIWRDQCRAGQVSADADQWFSDFLKLKCRLVYLPDAFMRNVDPEYAKPEDQVAFADGFPFLIVSEPSLDALNQAIGQQLPMSRFRPNLVIKGCVSYAEDYWREINIGKIDFRLPKPC